MTEKKEKVSLDIEFEKAVAKGKISNEDDKKIAGIADPKLREEAIKELLK